MEKKWNLQDIKPAKRASRPMRQPAATETAPREESYSSNPPARRAAGGKNNRKPVIVAVTVLVLLVAVGLIVGALIGGAKVTVFPRWREPVVNAAFEAKKQAAASELPFEMMNFEAEGARQVAASGEETVTEQASGEITIYKSTSGSERLIKNTRFASPDGLVFRITESAVVPGATTDGEGKTVPGSVTAKVFADEPGPKYNLPAGTKFTVPGFKENNLTDLYNAISAENKTAFTGGYDGPRYIVDDQEMSDALNSLRNELKEALKQRADKERPAGFTIFPNSYTFQYTTLPPEAVGEGQVKIKEKVSIKVPLFKDETLASYIAKGVIPGYEDEPVRIENVSTLSFEYVDPATVESDLGSADKISFKLSGKPKLIWVYDQEQLKKDLAGAPQTALNTVLGGYPAIEKASATIRPFWARKFPDAPEDISIIESLGN